MPMIEYVGKNFGVAAMQMIATANQIINAYAAQGSILRSVNFFISSSVET